MNKKDIDKIIEEVTNLKFYINEDGEDKVLQATSESTLIDIECVNNDYVLHLNEDNESKQESYSELDELISRLEEFNK